MSLPLFALVVAGAATLQPQPARTWYEQAESELLCNALGSDEERRSLAAPTVTNPRDRAGVTAYFKGAPKDERHARFRHLASLAAIGWWANRVNDQSVRLDAWVQISVLADRQATAGQGDPVFRQVARCARARILSAALELRRLDLVEMAATSLLDHYGTALPPSPVGDWPLLFAVRETRLDPKARAATGRLTTRVVELAGHALRAGQGPRAARLLLEGASAAAAIGDTSAARALATRAASSTTLRAPTDPRSIFELSYRLAVVADARGDYDAMGRHQLAAFRALANQASLDTPSLLFYRTALDLLLGRADSSVAVTARRNPARGAEFVASYLGQVETLIAQAQSEFVADVRSRAVSQYRIDNVLHELAELARVRPADRARLADGAFRLAQVRSFGRLNLAAITATARRANVAEAARGDLDRFFSQATQNGTWLRALLATIAVVPGQEPPSGDGLWRVIFALDVFQNETTRALPDFLAMVRRSVPAVAGLVTPRPLGVAEFQRRLRPDEALVATAVTSREIHVWAVTRAGVVQFRQPVREAELLDRIGRLRTSLTPVSGGGTTTVPPFDAAAAWDLYRWIFAPIEGSLRGIRSVSWYGNGPLGSIPPGVLVTAAPPKPLAASKAELDALSFLVDRHAIAVVPELSLFPMFRDRAAAPVQQLAFLGIGAPLLAASEIEGARRARAYDLAGGMDGKTLSELPKLEESVDEMRGMAGLFGDASSTLWLGPEADERKLATTDLTRFRTLAFATHGFLADEVQNVREPSLLLALKPDATDRYDGILTATEIASLRLDADLVILSACNTGSTDGRPGAETFTGLTQAFLTAGARSLMVSHWPVVSGAAVRLSVETVQGRVKTGASLPTGLQAAILALRKDAGNALEAHPGYWGPFVIVGDGR